MPSVISSLKVTRTASPRKDIEKVGPRASACARSLTHYRASHFSDPEELAAEAASAFGGPVAVLGDLDAFDF